MRQEYPRKRQEGLVVRDVLGEVLAYDRSRDKAFCLNETAAAVWRQCDGRTTPDAIARRLNVDERVVWYALDQLGKDHLLEARVGMPPLLAGLTRRQQLSALGKAAAIAVPVVSAVVAPPAAEARTCLGPGALCGTGAQCCSGVCSGGHCA